MAEPSTDTKRGRAGAVHYRSEKAQRLVRWRRRSPLNPYWIDWTALRRSVETDLPPHASGIMVDIGCSEAPYREVFAPVIDRYFGLEYPPSILDKQPELWQILDRAKRSVSFFGDGTALAVATASVDTVLATEVLEHLPEPWRLIDEAARVLKPGGKLLATVPFFQPLHELPGDYYRYTPSSLAHLMQRGGLEVVSITPRGNFASALGSMMSQFLLRWLCAKHSLPDGSVALSGWRSVLATPLIAVVQVLFFLASKVTKDTSVCLGYSVVARKPATAAGTAVVDEPARAAVV